MEQNERLSGALQENILSVLCFDAAHCQLVRAAVSPQLFESSVFREVAGHAIDFIDLYKEPIAEHLPDHLESILNGDDRRKSEAYKRLLDNLFQSKDSVNGEYVVQQLHKFVRQQNLKSAFVTAVEAFNAGDIDGAEVALQKGLNTQAVAFETGISLSNAEDINGILDNPEEEGFELGIPELDRNGNYPRRKELTLMIAPRGKGKSWFITHCAKQALLQRWSVVIITLEMGEKSYAGRFLQAFFSISRREAKVQITRLEKGRDGSLEDVIREEIERATMRDDDIREKLTSRAKREFGRRKPMFIKAFPTGALTIPMMEAYLDGLERFEGFTADAILVDYPDLFQIDSANLRVEVGKVVEKLRGIAVKRNAAMITVTQGNRESETAETVKGGMVAEDISKLATADLVFTYSQTEAEYSLGLARILVEKARNEAAKFSVLITQAYAIGQFCLDSVRLVSDYWEMMKGKQEREGGRRRRRRGEDDDN